MKVFDYNFGFFGVSIVTIYFNSLIQDGSVERFRSFFSGKYFIFVRYKQAGSDLLRR